MDIYELAGLADDRRAAVIGDIERRAEAVLYERAVGLVALVLVEFRRACPDAARVFFYDPQEPGGRVEVVRVEDADGADLFDDDDLDEADFDLAGVEDLLTAARDDGYGFTRPDTHPADHVLELIGPREDGTQ